MNEFHTIHWEVREGSGTLILNHPPSNKMTLLFFKELQQLSEMIRHTDDLRSVVVTGAGRHFSSGADLEELLVSLSQTTSDTDQEGILRIHSLETNYRSIAFFEELNIPVVAAIRGVCLGSAMELSLFCHFRFCTEDAVFGLPETSFNLMPGLGGINKFTKLSGKSQALRYILTGSTFDARVAKELGIVDYICSKKELMNITQEFLHNVIPSYTKEKRDLYKHNYLLVNEQAI